MMEFNIEVNFPEPSEKLKLEFEIEKTIAKGGVELNEIHKTGLFVYIENRDLESISSELIQLVMKKLALLIRNTKIDQDTAIDLFFQEASIPSDSENSLSGILDRNRAAVCRHLLKAARSVALAKSYSITSTAKNALGIIYVGALEVYEGDQSFYFQRKISASEIAAKGGLARAEIYRPIKERACALLRSMEPKDGWANRTEARKSILPEIKKYLTDNNIRRPPDYRIEGALSEWLRDDPLVSNAVRFAN